MKKRPERGKPQQVVSSAIDRYWRLAAASGPKRTFVISAIKPEGALLRGRA
jgi:hypothetical protein